MKKFIIVMILLILGCGREDRIAISPDGRMVIVGDSIASGYGVEKGFSKYLAERMTIEVVTLGKNGETTRGALKRMAEVDGYNPQVVMVELGGNDLLQKIEADETKRNLQTIINGLRSREHAVILVKFYPRRSLMNIFFRRGRGEYEKMYEEFEEIEGVYVIDNIWDGVWGRHMIDGIHPDSRGHEVMAENLLKSLKRIFKDEIFKEKG